GKSAVAQSLCQKLEAECCLTANFFFKRGHESRGNATRLFSTIAYQLAVILPQLNDIISQIVEKDPAIFEKSFSIQLQKLIVEPCRQIIPGRIAIIIVDGLDECRGEDVQQEILRCIGNSIQDPHLPVRFLISSRPEPHIRKMFKGPSLNTLRCSVNIEQSFEDVRRYLLHEFARIHRKHRTTMAAIPAPWPSSEVVEDLVKKSSGYFIYVSTVIKFIDDENFRPTDRLDIIMGVTEPDFGLPFGALDQLYTQILSEVPARPQLLSILALLGAKFHMSVEDIEHLLGLKTGDVRLMLRGLSSVIELPEPEANYDAVTAHHASFLDFLNDPARSGTFCVGGAHHRMVLARKFLEALSYKYEDPALNRVGAFAW
ncbi:hypothetical protein C8R44DRAFT_957736, partial [Mycena epipterygia]